MPHFRNKVYGLCLDNRKASHASKLVYMSIDLRINWENPSPEDMELINSISQTDHQADVEAQEHFENLDRMMVCFAYIRCIRI